MLTEELHVEWRDGEDVFTNIIIILTGANVVKTDCLHERYTADAACSCGATYLGNIAAVEAALKPWKRAGCPRSGMEGW